MTNERVEEIRRPSDRAFQLIAACNAAHFGDGLCAECVDAALAQAERERDELHQEKDGYVLEARHFERKYDEARTEVERLKEGHLPCGHPAVVWHSSWIETATGDADQGWCLWCEEVHHALEQAEATLARVRAALRHAIYRNHECTDACSACVEAEAALEGR